MNSQGISLCSTYQRLGTEKSQQSGNAKEREREKKYMLSPYLLFTDKKFTVNYLLPWNKIFCLNLGINLRKDLIGIIIIYFKFQWTRIEQMMFSTKEYSLYFMCFHIFFPSKFLIIFIQNFFSNSYKMQKHPF